MTAPLPPDRDPMVEAADRLARRVREGADVPEPSVGARLGQVGVLGWSIVMPTLVGLLIGRWIDHTFATGIFFSAPLIMVGAAVGFWSAWKWMHRS